LIALSVTVGKLLEQGLTPEKSWVIMRQILEVVSVNEDSTRETPASSNAPPPTRNFSEEVLQQMLRDWPTLTREEAEEMINNLVP
jgi:hypothetical protein